MILLFLISSLASADCTKDIKVLSYHEKAVPSLFDFSKKKYLEGETVITIKCDLYNKIKVGDTLEADGVVMKSRDQFTRSPVEIQYYQVIKK